MLFRVTAKRAISLQLRPWPFRFAEPHAGVVTRAERLPLTGSGNESRVDWRSTDETDQNALVVNAVDNRRTDSGRIIY